MRVSKIKYRLSSVSLSRAHHVDATWLSVVSVIGSGIISCLLLFHYVFMREYTYGGEESKKIRVSGRHFMLSIISLTSLLGLESLIFSMVESWTYLDGICEETH